MKALVFEQWQGGHYFNYLECLVPRLAALADEVVVAITERAASSAAFTRQLGHLSTLPNVRLDCGVPIPQPGNGLQFRLNLGRNVVAAVQRHQPDFVFLPSADEQVLALPLLAIAGRGRGIRGVPIEAVIHYKSYTAMENARERMLSGMQRQLLKTGVFSRLNFVNFLQYEDAVSQRRPWAAMARAAGDPVPQRPRQTRRAARAALGLDPDGRYFGMVGDLDPRKAVPATIAAFRAANLGPNDRLLLAGRMTPTYATLVQESYADLVRAGRLVLLDRFLDDDELAAAFAALDVHASVYNGFTGLSSLMLKSLAAGVPVMVGHKGWGAAVAKRFQVGWTVDPAQTDDYAATLRKALEAGIEHEETAAVRRLLQFHSVANFTEGLVERAAALAGRPSDVGVLPWSWVLEALPPERRALR